MTEIRKGSSCLPLLSQAWTEQEKTEGRRNDVVAQASKRSYPRQEAGSVFSSWVFRNQEDSQLSGVVTVTD